MHACIHTYTYIHYIRLHYNTYIHACMPTYIDVSMHVCMYVHTYVYMYLYVCVHTITCIQTSIHACLQACMHEYVHNRTYMHTLHYITSHPITSHHTHITLHYITPHDLHYLHAKIKKIGINIFYIYICKCTYVSMKVCFHVNLNCYVLLPDSCDFGLRQY